MQAVIEKAREWSDGHWTLWHSTLGMEEVNDTELGYRGFFGTPIFNSHYELKMKEVPTFQTLEGVLAWLVSEDGLLLGADDLIYRKGPVVEIKTPSLQMRDGEISVPLSRLERLFGKAQKRADDHTDKGWALYTFTTNYKAHLWPLPITGIDPLGSEHRKGLANLPAHDTFEGALAWLAEAPMRQVDLIDVIGGYEGHDAR